MNEKRIMVRNKSYKDVIIWIRRSKIAQTME